jgi:HD superfamily phosphodiesterase
MDLNRIENRIFQLALPFLSIMNNDAHTLDAVDFAFRLLATENGERDIVIPSLILHDVGWSKVPKDLRSLTRKPGSDKSVTRMHELEGVEIARNILDNLADHYLPVDEIIEIINGHDTRVKAISIHDEIVKDADKLSRYSVAFWDIVQRSGIDPEELCVSLESRAREWFFLPLSREIAEENLRQRRREIGRPREGRKK